MYFAGAVLVFFLFTGGFAIAELVFYRHTGRLFWRALLPPGLRYAVLPSDPVCLDAFMVMEEYAAAIFCGSFILLIMLAMHIIGFISLF